MADNIEPTTTTSLLSTQQDVAKLDLLDYEAYLIAVQLTLLDYSLFKAIPPHEFIKKKFTDPEKAPNFNKIADQWNKVGDR